VFASMAYLWALQGSQWTPLLTAATAFPALGWVFAAKPTMGAALWLAYPSKRGLIAAATLTALALAVCPW
jgi:hypothetical protein